MKRLLAYSILVVYYCLLFGLFARSAFAADSAMFSVAAQNTTYAVGDDIQVSLSVDAGPYASTLSVIDLAVKVSDMTVIEPADKTVPFVPGTIYPSVFNQSVSDNLVSAVFYINPENKPASRSGLVATATFKALKAGSATISYDSVKATEEKTENDFISTSASSLVVNVTEAGGTAVTTGSTSSGLGETAYVAVTPTTAVAATQAATGPEMVVLVSVAGGILLFILHRILGSKMKRARW